jgi:hypothetical protein
MPILNTADATCRVVFVKYKALAKKAGVDAGEVTGRKVSLRKRADWSQMV